MKYIENITFDEIELIARLASGALAVILVHKKIELKGINP